VIQIQEAVGVAAPAWDSRPVRIALGILAGKKQACDVCLHSIIQRLELAGKEDGPGLSGNVGVHVKTGVYVAVDSL
jgi:hypothetical protein